MPYNIYKSDGTTLSVPNGIVDQNFNNSTANAGKGIGVQIVGLTSTNYVVPTAQNFLQITENFCGSIIPPDNKALQGQLWFNKLSSTTGKLYVRISGALVGGLANWREVVVGDTTVIPGSYSAANITVDAQGRITSAANGIGGGGSVLSVSVTTANGVSGVVTTPTTTPAITLTLGAITPTSVASTGDISVETAGNGLKIKEGSNAKMGVATLVLGTLVVSTTAVTANSRIFLTAQSLGTITVPAALAVSARTAATSFTILSSDLTDTSDVAWMIVEPA